MTVVFTDNRGQRWNELGQKVIFADKSEIEACYSRVMSAQKERKRETEASRRAAFFHAVAPMYLTPKVNTPAPVVIKDVPVTISVPQKTKVKVGKTVIHSFKDLAQAMQGV